MEETGLGFGDEDDSSAAAVFALVARLGLPTPTIEQLRQPMPTYVT